MKRFMILLLGALPAAGIFSHVFPAAAAANPFGFNGPEVFPIEQQISLLHVADLDGDGLNDIVVVNNLHSKIALL